jgi:hypothetical protein
MKRLVSPSSKGSSKLGQPSPFDSTPIIPVSFLVKFDPPLIAMLYKRGPKDKKKHVYNILLNGLINIMDPEEITK